MTPVRALAEVVEAQTTPHRKGEIVEIKDEPGLQVVNITNFPPVPQRGTLVDMHFIQVGFTEAAADCEGFVEALRAALTVPGEFCEIDEHILRSGPSYITLGGWLGDQTLALRFMALCEFHELGQVITPKTMGMDNEMADLMAGRGMIFCPAKLPAPVQ